MPALNQQSTRFLSRSREYTPTYVRFTQVLQHGRKHLRGYLDSHTSTAASKIYTLALIAISNNKTAERSTVDTARGVITHRFHAFGVVGQPAQTKTSRSKKQQHARPHSLMHQSAQSPLMLDQLLLAESTTASQSTRSGCFAASSFSNTSTTCAMVICLAAFRQMVR